MRAGAAPAAGDEPVAERSSEKQTAAQSDQFERIQAAFDGPGAASLEVGSRRRAVRRAHHLSRSLGGNAAQHGRGVASAAQPRAAQPRTNRATATAQAFAAARCTHARLLQRFASTSSRPANLFDALTRSHCSPLSATSAAEVQDVVGLGSSRNALRRPRALVLDDADPVEDRLKYLGRSD